MSRTRRPAGLFLGLVLAVPQGFAMMPASAAGPAPEEERTRIVHALNRLAYGPRPGEVDAIARLGLAKWIDRQLSPEKISDEDAEARLGALRTTRLSTRELLAKYGIPREARREIQQARAQLGESPSEEDVKRVRRELIAKYGPQMDGSPRLVLEELQQAKLLRAIYSERQLDEVLVDFWMNHFNVYALKGPARFLIGEYEREVIRPHAWGKFEDLLKATAESPAMLFYLDNWLSADPNAKPAFEGRARLGRLRGRAAEAGRGRRRGLNENYAREIMELHTLGVDGGYTQKDVTEVARCFTGWTIKGLRQQHPEFSFESRLHDDGDKVVLGQAMNGSGKYEGDAVIHLLATHPSTARFIALKLARRFVADEPPPALVDRAASVFTKTGGNIGEVVRLIVTSPEFSAPEARAAKVKTPLEFVVSAVRTGGARVVDARELATRVAAMGMPLYQQQPPTGYKDVAEAWVSANGLVARLNFGLDLAAGRVPGVLVDSAPGLAREAGLMLGSPAFQRR